MRMIMAAALVSGLMGAQSILPRVERVGLEPMNSTEFSGAAGEARALLATLRADVEAPGLAAVVVVEDSVVLLTGVGYADLSEQTPITPQTQFRLASVSKLLTAAATARLAQTGILDLEAPISEYVLNAPPGWSGVTPQRLAGHLGGIRNYLDKDFADGSHIDRRHFESTQDALEIFRSDALVSVPGERYLYSTFGFTLLAAVLEGATGTPFRDLMRRELFEPLSMQSTRFEDGTSAEALLPSGFFVRANGGLQEGPEIDPSYKYAGAGMLTSAADMGQFLRVHLREGFFSDSILRLLFDSQSLSNGDTTGVSLAWKTGRDSAGRRIVHHAGSMDGARSVVVVYPDHGVGIAILSNLTLAPVAAEASAQVVASPFLDLLEGYQVTPFAPVGEYRFELGEGGKGDVQIVPATPTAIGWMTAPLSFKARGRRFGIDVPESLKIISMKIRTDARDGRMILSTPLGLYAIGGSWDDDDSFEGGITTLYPAGLRGRFVMRRVSR